MEKFIERGVLIFFLIVLSVATVDEIKPEFLIEPWETIVCFLGGICGGIFMLMPLLKSLTCKN